MIFAIFSPGPLAGIGLGPLQAGRYAVLANGLVLAVPDSAVIDTGAMKIVYRQTAPDVFDGVEVQLGPRMTEPGNPTVFYPVIQWSSSRRSSRRRMAPSLIDFETPAQPGLLASVYFPAAAAAKRPRWTSCRRCSALLAAG